MKRFEAGVSYYTAGGKVITVTKRTEHYITFTGDYTGRKKVAEQWPFDGTESCIVGQGADKRFLTADCRTDLAKLV